MAIPEVLNILAVSGVVEDALAAIDQEAKADIFSLELYIARTACRLADNLFEKLNNLGLAGVNQDYPSLDRATFKATLKNSPASSASRDWINGYLHKLEAIPKSSDDLKLLSSYPKPECSDHQGSCSLHLSVGEPPNSLKFLGKISFKDSNYPIRPQKSIYVELSKDRNYLSLQFDKLPKLQQMEVICIFLDAATQALPKL
jgi:hypothetical protein